MAARPDEESVSGRGATAFAWAGVLAASFLLYAREESLEHFLWHLGYGGAFGLVAAAALQRAGYAQRVGPALAALGGYLFMVVPDVLWVAPTLVGRPPWPHETWMNVFLGHVALDAWAWATPALPFVLAAAALVAAAMGRREEPGP